MNSAYDKIIELLWEGAKQGEFPFHTKARAEWSKTAAREGAKKPIPKYGRQRKLPFAPGNRAAREVIFNILRKPEAEGTTLWDTRNAASFHAKLIRKSKRKTPWSEVGVHRN